MAQASVKRCQDFLPQKAYPIRTGVHPNKTFKLAFAIDYARAGGYKEFEQMIGGRARSYFENDRGYPTEWEPGGKGFFSPALIESDLMRRALPPQEFQGWFQRFLRDLGKQVSLLKPAMATDRSHPSWCIWMA